MNVLFEGIRKTFQSATGEIAALHDVSFSVDSGMFVTIVGPSGCGKTTLLNILAGLETPSSGSVTVNGVPVTGTSPTIGYMPQRDELLDWRTIWGNITLVLEIQGLRDEIHCKRAKALLDRYGLSAFEKKLPGQLSGGMRQRCALIRTLASDPGLLLLDEPFSSLDYQTRLSVSDDIYSIIRREEKTAILVTHDISEAISMSDRVIVLTARPGRIRSVHDLSSMSALKPMQRRDHPEFHRYFNAIWKELDPNG